MAPASWIMPLHLASPQTYCLTKSFRATWVALVAAAPGLIDTAVSMFFNPKDSNYVCPLCDLEAVGNELHYIVECPMFKEERAQLAAQRDPYMLTTFRNYMFSPNQLFLINLTLCINKKLNNYPPGAMWTIILYHSLFVYFFAVSCLVNVFYDCHILSCVPLIGLFKNKLNLNLNVGEEECLGKVDDIWKDRCPVTESAIRVIIPLFANA